MPASAMALIQRAHIEFQSSAPFEFDSFYFFSLDIIHLLRAWSEAVNATEIHDH